MLPSAAADGSGIKAVLMLSVERFPFGQNCSSKLKESINEALELPPGLPPEGVQVFLHKSYLTVIIIRLVR